MEYQWAPRHGIFLTVFLIVTLSICAATAFALTIQQISWRH